MSSPKDLPALSHIFNLSINTKTFPSQWKHAQVTPIYKKGDVLSKLFEKIIDELACS